MLKEHYFKNKYFEMWLHEGIIHAVFARNINVSEDVARMCANVRIKLSGGITRPSLFDMRNVRSIDKTARKYFSKSEACRYLSAGAYLTKTTMQKLSCSAFIMINRPSHPAELFTDEYAAVRWLAYYKNLN